MLKMQPGIDVLSASSKLLIELKGRRLALLGHPASVNSRCCHALDVLMNIPGFVVTAAFGPQHGMRGEKQDNMIESEDYFDPKHHIPVFSLYGKVRRPTQTMMDTFDVLLVDLQDIGTRIYTFLTTLFYMMESCLRYNKSIYVLDRPNPAGRPVEGTILTPGWESFVGAAPVIMRHGMTLGELAKWYQDDKKLDLDINIVPMKNYDPDQAPGYGWPLGHLPWINPSPNASTLNMARCYPGTVLFEGTTLSEGRGTTMPLELVGAPDIDFNKILTRLRQNNPLWLKSCFLRACYFEPTYHKHKGTLCSGIQIHTDHSHYNHTDFHPYRIAAGLLKAIRHEYPDYNLWQTLPYEYETERLAIDLLSGGTFLRHWVDDSNSTPEDLEEYLKKDELLWREMRKKYLIYGHKDKQAV